MARRRRAVWNEEIARNVVKDYASGISTEDIAAVYRVPEKAVVHYLEQYGLLFKNAGAYQDEEYIVQARILQQMAEGRNPYTGIPLPVELTEHVEIMQALSAGAAALLAGKTPSRSGKPWKLAEEECLRDLRAQGRSNAQIAKRLGRSERAVEFKVEKIEDRDAHDSTEEQKREAMRKVRLRRKTEKSADWSAEDVRKLRDMSESGMDVLNIAAYFGRTVEETQAQMARLEKR